MQNYFFSELYALKLESEKCDKWQKLSNPKFYQQMVSSLTLTHPKSCMFYDGAETLDVMSIFCGKYNDMSQEE